ncbi:hypothetical protein OS493_033611 [Desmophyllum pertusum]|uniref:Uncharacterized protein n=1 Tax=Desmophyllum pertusum TaxID=174260 RepID=A0A9W9YVN5_9CNID|nr:hypothetical protein OS493_033611 [Desmophyllum pertusum]
MAETTWAEYGTTFTLTVGATVGAKFACNAVLPGSGAAVDFFLAGKCLYNGDKTGAAINTVSGIADLVSFGLAGCIKDAMKGGAKTAATETAKQTAKSASKEATKNVGEELSKQLATGVIEGSAKSAAVEATKVAAKSCL